VPAAVVIDASVLVMAGTLVGMRKIAVAFSLAPTCLSFLPRPIRSDEKSASSEGMIVVWSESALGFVAKVQARDRRLHVWPVLGEGVEESRHEHVARQAA
jgi:hypothetical protein